MESQMPNSNTSKITLLGYATDLGGACPGNELGPQQIIDSPLMQSIDKLIGKYQYLYPEGKAHGLSALPLLHEINKRLAVATEQLTRAKKDFVVLGGDHSSAIGTWSGVSTGLAKEGDLGLIWFDAHMDSHTPETTPSGNIHGMPLAALLGHGDTSLTHLLTPNPKLKPEHVCLIGIRSFEAAEKELLDRLKVRIFTMQEIKERGLEIVLSEALSIATSNTAGFGISFDLDAIDPLEAPGVSTPAPDGLSTLSLYTALKAWNNHPLLTGLEIAEFNPTFDIKAQTETIIFELIHSLYSPPRTKQINPTAE